MEDIATALAAIRDAFARRLHDPAEDTAGEADPELLPLLLKLQAANWPLDGEWADRDLTYAITACTEAAQTSSS